MLLLILLLDVGYPCAVDTLAVQAYELLPAARPKDIRAEDRVHQLAGARRQNGQESIAQL